MTAPEIVTIIVVVSAVLLPAIGLMVSSIIGKLRDKIDVVRADTEAIKGHVNSEKTAAEGRETALKQRVTLLEQMIVDKDKTAALLAQSVVQSATAKPHPVSEVKIVNTSDDPANIRQTQ